MQGLGQRNDPPVDRPWSVVPSLPLRPSDRATPVSALRDGSTEVWYTYEAEAVEIEFSSPPPSRTDGLPYSREVAAMIAGFGAGPPYRSVRVPTAPSGGSRSPTLERGAAGLPPSQAYVRFRDAGDEVGYTYDVVGDGTHLVENTYDGRAIGLRLSDWQRGVLANEAVPYRREVRALLDNSGVPLDDTRLRLEAVSWGLGPGGVGRPEAPGVPLIVQIGPPCPAWAPTEKLDLRGDGLVLAAVSQADGLVHVWLKHPERGVDLRGLPDATAVQRILRHLRLPLTG